MFSISGRRLLRGAGQTARSGVCCALSAALILLATALCAAQTRREPNGSRPPAAPSFAHDVLPIFRTACVGCHGGAHPAGSLALTSCADLMRGGQSGPALVAGKSGESRLVRLLLGTLQPQMPPGGALKPGDIAAIRAWIDAGAKNDTALPTAGKAPAHTLGTAAGTHRAALPAAGAAARTRLRVPTPVTALAFRPDGRLLAVGTYREVQFRDVATGRLLAVWGGHTEAVHALRFTPDGRWLAAGSGVPSASGEIRIRDMAAGREVRTLGGHTDFVTALAFSPDVKTLASGSVDKTVKIWDVTTGTLLRTLRDHADAVWSVDYSPDGKYLASCSGDRSVKVWDPATGKRLYTIDAHDDIIYDVAFSPDGKSLLTASADRSAKLWAFGAESAAYVRTLEGHAQAVLSAAFAPDGKTLATASADRTVRLWRTGDGGSVRTLSEARDWIYAIRFSPDSKRLAAGTWDGTVLLWNTAAGTLETTFSTLSRPTQERSRR